MIFQIVAKPNNIFTMHVNYTGQFFQQVSEPSSSIIIFTEYRSSFQMISKVFTLACVIFTLMIIAQLATSENSRGLSRLVGQQPLLFGRRGINPNMNSLFFGKRAVDQSVLDEMMMDKCSALYSTCQKYIQARMQSSDEI